MAEPVLEACRSDGLEKGRGRANRLPIGGELSDDRPYELKELRSAEDGIAYVCGLDQLLHQSEGPCHAPLRQEGWVALALAERCWLG